MATIEQLTKDGDNIYPVTKAEAVYDDDNVTVQSRIDSGVYLDDTATPEPETPWVTGSMIDFNSFSGDGHIEIGNYLIQWGETDFGNQTFTTDYWSMFNRSGNERMYITYPIPFSEPAVVMLKAAKTATPFISVTPTGDNNSATRSHDFCMVVPKAYTTTVRVRVQWIAIGKK